MSDWSKWTAKEFRENIILMDGVCLGCRQYYDNMKPHHFIKRAHLPKKEHHNPVYSGTLCRTCHSKAHGTIRVIGYTHVEFQIKILEEHEDKDYFRWHKALEHLRNIRNLKGVGK